MESVMYQIDNLNDPGNPLGTGLTRRYISISVVSIELSVSATI